MNDEQLKQWLDRINEGFNESPVFNTFANAKWFKKYLNAIVKLPKATLKGIPFRLKDDYEVIMAFIKKDPWNVRHVDYLKRIGYPQCPNSQRMRQAVIARLGPTICFRSQPKKPVAVDPEDARDMARSQAASDKGACIAPDEQALLTWLKKNPSSIKQMSCPFPEGEPWNQNLDFLKKALEANPKVADHVDPSLRLNASDGGVKPMTSDQLKPVSVPTRGGEKSAVSKAEAPKPAP